jgi:hypothetical protein
MFVHLTLKLNIFSYTHKSCVQNRSCVENEPVLENFVLRQHKLVLFLTQVSVRFVFSQHRLDSNTRSILNTSVNTIFKCVFQRFFRL